MVQSPCLKFPDDSTIEKLLPTAVKTGSWELYLLSFLFLAAALLNPIVFIYAYLKHKSFNWIDYKNILRVLAFIFMLYRFVVTLAPFKWSSYALVFFAILAPLLLQFTYLCLCVVFVIWKAMKTYNRKSTLVVVSYVLILAALWISAFIGAEFMCPTSTIDTSVVASLLIGLFGALQGLVAYWSYNMMKLSLNPASRNVTYKFMLAISVLLFCAVVRAIWNVTNLFGINPIDDLFTMLLIQKSPAAYSIFLGFYGFVEMLPTAISTLILAGEDIDSANVAINYSPYQEIDTEDILPGHTYTLPVQSRSSYDEEASSYPTTPVYQSPSHQSLARLSSNSR